MEKCPQYYFSYLELQSSTLSSTDFKVQIRDRLICDESVDKDRIANFVELKSYVDSGWCAAYTVNSAAVLGRCIPQIFMDFGTSVERQLQSNGSLDKLIASLGNGGGLVPTDQQINNSGHQ